jgi:hypothetical protein
MNCHNNNEHNSREDVTTNKKTHMKHMILMVLCCAIPIILLLVLPILNLPEGGNLSSFLSFGIFLLCPLLHIVMMKGMMKHSNHQKEDQ